MKLRRPVKEKKTGSRKTEKVIDGSWTADREKFVDLEPLKLSRQKGSVMECDIRRRPYLSLIAKQEGFKYLTIPTVDGKMLVVKYEI